MQVRPKKSNKKKIITIIIIPLLLVGCVFAYLCMTRPRDLKSTSDKNNASSESTSIDSSVDTDESDKSSTNSINSEITKVEDKTPIQYEGEQIDDEPTTDNEQFRIPEE